MLKTKSKKEKIEILKKQLIKYKELSIHDDLTGLYNRRKLQKDINYFLKKQNNKIIITMIDVNNFKLINDTEGHITGDQKLIEVGNVIRDNIRKYDKIYRIGGDEFILILSDYDLKTAKLIINRIKKKLKNKNIKISVGSNKLCHNILEILDKKMYEDKRNSN